MSGSRKPRSIAWRGLLTLALLFGAGCVWAAEPTTADVINSLYNSFVAPIRKFGTALSSTGVGVGLVGSIVALYVIAGGLSYAAGTADAFSLAVRGARLSLTAALVLAAIQPQSWFKSMSGYETMGRAIEAGFYIMIKWAADANNLADAVDPDSLVRTVANSALTALFKMGEVPVFPPNISMWKAFTHVTGLLAGLLMWFICMIAYIIAGAMILGEAVAADLTIQVALAFAPLMVPWLLFAPMRFLFDAWVKTLLVGGVGFLIALLFCCAMTAFANAASNALNATVGNSFESTKLIATFSPILLGSVVMIMIASKVMSFAHSLVSGGGMSGLSLDSFKMAVGTVSAAAAAPINAARSTASAARTSADTARRGVGMVSAGLNSLRAVGTPSQRAKSQGARAVSAAAQRMGKAPGSAETARATAKANKAYSAARFSGKGREEAQTLARQAASSSLATAPAKPPSHQEALQRMREKAERSKALRRS